jgi:RsiW-degrading membrane proteinase PrsW (M82 family)
MNQLFTSGHIVDLILGVMAVEAMLMYFYHRKSGKGIAPVDALVNLFAGGCLLLALRGALVQAPWGWIAASLVAALIAHTLDLRRRWRR